MLKNRASVWVIILAVTLALVQLACNLPIMSQAEQAAGLTTPTVPAWMSTFSPQDTLPPGTPGAVPSEGATVTPGGDSCVYRMTFLSDVTIPDNTTIPAGQTFIKTWRVRNDGTCTWGPVGHPLHALAYSDGEKMDAPDEVPLPQEVKPGESVDISVTMRAPDEAGTYVSKWLMRVDGEPSGRNWLGIGAKGTDPLYVLIKVAAGQ